MARRGSADLTYGAGRPAQNRTAPAQRSCAHTHDAPARVPCVGSSVSYKSLCACARTATGYYRAAYVVLPCPWRPCDSLETAGPREQSKYCFPTTDDARQRVCRSRLSPHLSRRRIVTSLASCRQLTALARAQVSLLGRIRLGRIRLGRIRLGRRALGRNGARPG